MSDSWPPTGDALLDALIALNHPARRRLYELLSVEGPSPVRRLAERTGLASGSVSHHLKALHRAGFVVPAPELARDTRESWWRSQRRRLSWSADDYPAGTVGRRVAELAERANLDHLSRATLRWMRTRHTLRGPWSELGFSIDSVVAATPRQFAGLEQRLNDVITEWDMDCRADATVHPDAARHPVRVIARVFPSRPA